MNVNLMFTHQDNPSDAPPPEMRLQLMKVWVSSWGYLYSQYQMEKPSGSKFSQKWGRATVSVSSLEYFLLHSSITNELRHKTRNHVRKQGRCQTTYSPAGERQITTNKLNNGRVYGRFPP